MLGIPLVASEVASQPSSTTSFAVSHGSHKLRAPRPPEAAVPPRSTTRADNRSLNSVHCRRELRLTRVGGVPFARGVALRSACVDSAAIRYLANRLLHSNTSQASTMGPHQPRPHGVLRVANSICPRSASSTRLFATVAAAENQPLRSKPSAGAEYGR